MHTRGFPSCGPLSAVMGPTGLWCPLAALTGAPNATPFGANGRLTGEGADRRNAGATSMPARRNVLTLTLYIAGPAYAGPSQYIIARQRPDQQSGLLAMLFRRGGPPPRHRRVASGDYVAARRWADTPRPGESAKVGPYDRRLRLLVVRLAAPRLRPEPGCII